MTKISRRCVIVLVSVVMLFTMIVIPGISSSADETSDLTAFEQEFLSPDDDARPFMRWWIAPGRMNEEETRREIKAFADGGYAGVELQTLELAKGCQINDETWNETMKWILQAGLDYGVQIDCTIGQFWPISTPELTDIDDTRAEQVFRTGNTTFTATEENGGVYTRSSYLFPSALVQTRAWEFIAVTAVKRTSGSTTEYDPATAVNLLDESQETTFNSETGEISWTAPSEGTWTVFYFYRQSSGRRLGFGINQIVVDHMSADATRAVTKNWEDAMDSDPELERLYEENGGSIFGDSFELSSNLWTKNMLEEFKERRGYDLTPYLPAISNTFSGIGGRIRNDVNTTMTELLAENHMSEFREWAGTHNMTLRYQAYSSAGSSNFELTAPALAVDIIEVEAYAMSGTNTDAYRQVSGAVHMRGDKIFSSETGEIGNDSWRGTWTDTQRRDGSSSRHLGFMYYANRQFAAGVNKMVFHGATYKMTDLSDNYFPTTVTWPGYSAMSALSYGNEWDDKTPMWENIDIMTDYLSRTQMVLQQGQGDIDLAMYRSMYGKGNTRSSMTAVEQAGYTYDYVTPTILDMDNAVLGTQDGKTVLAADGPSYKALIIEPMGSSSNTTPVMPLKTAEKILDYAKGGLPVVIVGTAPNQAAGYPGNDDNVGSASVLEEADAQLAEYMSELALLENVRTVTANATRSNIAGALSELGVVPDAQPEIASNVYFQHRDTEDADLYFIYNDGTAASSQTLTLKGAGAPYLLNPWSGEITPIAKYTAENGTVTIDINLDSQDTMLVAIAGEGWSSKKLENTVKTTAADSVVYDEETSNFALRSAKGGNLDTVLSDGTSVNVLVGAAEEPINLTNWTMVLNRWTQGSTVHDTVVVPSDPYDLSEIGLVPWYEIDPINLRRVAGVGVYTTSFEVKKGWEEGQGAYLDFTRVSDGARLFVNDTEVSINQVSLSADIGKYLVAGTNTIMVEVSSNMSNVMFGTANNNTWDFGIIGAVTLTPYMQVPVPAYQVEYTTYEEFDSNIQYDGAWSNTDSMFFSAKRAKKSITVGNSATFTFEGRAFQLVSYKSASQGIISISIDGQAQDTVDLYDTGYDTAFGTIAYDSPLLLPGKHTVTISIVGKNPKATASGFYLDAINVTGELIPVEPIISDSVYQMESADAAAVITLPAGTDIQITGEPTGGTAVAGNGKIVYTPNSMAAEDSITYKVGDQTATVTIQKAAVTRYEETFAGYEKTGTWPSYNVAQYSGGSAYRTATKDSAISFTFTGTGFDVISYKSFTRGTFQVTVEDSSGNTVVDQEVDCWDVSADTLFQNTVYESGALAKGTYKVTITVLQNRNVEFDAVEVFR